VAGDATAPARPILLNLPSLALLELRVVTPVRDFLHRVPHRAGAGVVLVVLFSGRALLAQATILPRDAAVTEYEMGLQALKRKDFRTAIDRMRAALATGYTRPAQAFGTGSHQLEWYDPFYWLGVASMELGQDEQARRCFILSREGGVIQKRAEYADLLERMRVLDVRDEARRSPSSPEPTLAGRAPASAAPVPAPTARARPKAESPSAVRRRMASLIPLIEAIAQARFGEAEAELVKVRARNPESAEPELLAAVLYGSRFVLEGSVDPRLVAKAKEGLDNFRQRGGSPSAEKAWLSPALRALLGG
jgi:hypothetical protein